jgi:hypothetical protein
MLRVFRMVVAPTHSRLLWFRTLPDPKHCALLVCPMQATYLLLLHVVVRIDLVQLSADDCFIVRLPYLTSLFLDVQ